MFSFRQQANAAWQRANGRELRDKKICMVASDELIRNTMKTVKLGNASWLLRSLPEGISAVNKNEELLQS
jgi:hypothetical protein